MNPVDELFRRGWSAPRAAGTLSYPVAPGDGPQVVAQYYSTPTPRAPIQKKLGAKIYGPASEDPPMAEAMAAEAMLAFLDSGTLIE